MLDHREIDIGIMVVDNARDIPNSSTHLAGAFVCVSAKKIKVQNKLLLTEKRPEVEILKKKLGSLQNVPILEIASWDLIADYASKGLGVGLIPDFFLKTQIGSKLRLSPKLGSIHKYFLITRILKVTPATAAFLEQVKKIGKMM